MRPPTFEPFDSYRAYSAGVMRRRSKDFLREMRRRRTIRDFSDRPVPREVIENCIRTAMSAPSGANQQPWQFVVIQDADLKRRIRREAESVEREFYAGRAPDEWLEALAPLGTDHRKPFLEIAPFLIVVLAELHGVTADGAVVKHYYVNESVGIASGFLIAALHHAGLVCLTHTPSPMRFLSRILDRPRWQKPFLLLAVGYPAAAARVPRISKKSLAEVCRFL